ncbi:MAG: glycosyltransferase family protein [Ginsengibacter sp.]
MKILYAIQGTGNGHISRARDIIPALKKKGDVDILVSGTQVDIQIQYQITYRLNGLSFIFGKNGGVDLLETYKKSNLKKFYNEVKALPVRNYDLVINDFEPVSAWACRLINKPCIGLSHQAAVINNKSPKPEENDIVGKTILKRYAPVTASYGFHFISYDDNIFTPVIRNEIRSCNISDNNYYTVYLPAYNDKRLIEFLSKLTATEWHVFSKHTNKTYKEGNVLIMPIQNEAFINSMSGATGVLCGAGFETPAEVLFMNKKLMVIPMKGQYEQQCNAASLKEMGIPVIKTLKEKHISKVQQWISSNNTPLIVNYPDVTDEIINKVISEQFHVSHSTEPHLGDSPYSIKKLKKLTLGKMLAKVSS